MIKTIVRIIAMLLVCIILSGCSGNSLSEETDINQPSEQLNQKANWEVDYLKISPMIEENAEKSVLDAALKVIEAFLNYENQAVITIDGNRSRFLNDLGYVVNSTCPMFAAFTDYNEMTAYDEEKSAVVWNFLIPRDEFQKMLSDFTAKVEDYLSMIDCEDSDAMKAILIYYSLVSDASYDFEILGEANEKIDESEYRLRESPYNVLVNKKGICTNLSQALMFLFTQVDLKSGTVLHQGGVGAHMWVIVEVDDKYYYCDPTWDVGDGLKTFGITAEDRSSWAGGYAKAEGKMLATVIDQKYKIDDDRFAEMREKIPVEITEIKPDKKSQEITFKGYDYEYVFCCMQ